MTFTVSSSVGFSPASRNRLTEYDLGRFPGDTLLDHVGRAACHAACLPRKELYEFESNTDMNLDSSAGAKVFGVLIILATLGLYWIFRGSAVIPF